MMFGWLGIFRSHCCDFTVDRVFLKKNPAKDSWLWSQLVLTFFLWQHCSKNHTLHRKLGTGCAEGDLGVGHQDCSHSHPFETQLD